MLTGTPTGKRLLGRPRRDRRKILKWNLKKQVSIGEIGLIRLRIGIIGSTWECGIEAPGSISHRVSY